MANRRKLTEEEKEERRKWRAKPWTTKSSVLLPDGSTRPYDPKRDLLDHIVNPLLDHFTGGALKATWKPEYQAHLDELSRQEARENTV